MPGTREIPSGTDSLMDNNGSNKITPGMKMNNALDKEAFPILSCRAVRSNRSHKIEKTYKKKTINFMCLDRPTPAYTNSGLHMAPMQREIHYKVGNYKDYKEKKNLISLICMFHSLTSLFHFRTTRELQKSSQLLHPKRSLLFI